MPLFSARICRLLVSHRSLRFAVPLTLPVLLFGAVWARGADEPKIAQTPPVDTAAYDKQIKPLLQQYCISCHGAANFAAGVSLTKYADVAAIQRDQTTWRKVLAQVRGRSMPPARSPQPSMEQRDLLSVWIGHTLASADDSLLPKNPGRVLLHRLSRVEYNNTVRELFGVSSNPADKFPADGGGGGGFDNNADTLFVPPILMERYLQAATDILAETKPERLFVVRPGKTVPAREAARQTSQPLRHIRLPPPRRCNGSGTAITPVRCGCQTERRF